jgi:ABC-type uncharacterized transport system fused permease/ATPase subunit
VGRSVHPIGTTHSIFTRLSLGSRSIDELLCPLRSPTATAEQLAVEAAEAADSSRVVSFDATSVDTPEPDGRSRRLVTGLTLQVTPGQNVLVTGPNGCGKTSLFRVLAGLWQPVGGTVHCPRDHLMWYVSALAEYPPSAVSFVSVAPSEASRRPSTQVPLAVCSMTLPPCLYGRLPQKPYLVVGTLRDQARRFPTSR